ncbi:HmuY family protein [Chitinophaga nivalis]|uniref:HmuY family protein n=1 Tax=Chitinophaga nivalis TaxID=2991709 RepID=A0ABT3IU19_9BACT|nr:HmuY family protein [Chitinophaga nivalis]MCW3463116.1 HmuY family protein [Chitinophaga nivalis]MCW3487194.1 HmuY family protein [Chitinophaga nivalis]
MRLNYGIIVLLLAGMTACKKDNNEVKNTRSYEDGKSTVIYDMAGDTRASVGGGIDDKEKRPFKPFLFSFKTGKQSWDTSAANLKSNSWDVAFTELYNAMVVVNNGKNSKSPGNGGNGVGEIVFYDQPYATLTTAPDDEYFKAHNMVSTGWDGYPLPSNRGWYFYSLTTHLARPIPNRTFVIRTADGQFAKLELISMYKGNPPTVTDLLWPAPYFTFRYFLQTDGSRNLTTPNN